MKNLVRRFMFVFLLSQIVVCICLAQESWPEPEKRVHSKKRQEVRDWFGVRVGWMAPGSFNAYSAAGSKGSGGLTGGIFYDFASRRMVTLGISIDGAFLQISGGGSVDGSYFDFPWKNRQKLLLDGAVNLKLGRHFVGTRECARLVFATGFGYGEMGVGKTAYYMLTMKSGVELLFPVSENSRVLFDIGLWGSPVSWVGRSEFNRGSANLRLLLRTGYLF